jgi:hypothetical protein
MGELGAPITTPGPDFSPRVWKGGALQAAEKRVGTVILRSRRRRRISHCLDNAHSEILRSAQDDSGGAGEEQRVGAAISAGLKPRPSGSSAKSLPRAEESERQPIS